MRGRAVKLSAPRRFLVDLLRLSSHIPTVPVQRRMELGEVADVRRAAKGRPSWPAVFLKAFARVAAAMPELRRAYVCLPRPHLYEYPSSVASVAVERDYQGEKAIFFGRIADPANLPLTTIEAHLREFVESPIEAIKPFRKLLRAAGWPGPLRRFLMWFGLNLPRSRPVQFGTFGLSVYSSLGAESLHPISPLTITLTYGVIHSDGTVDVRIVYDHRVLDGATVARALARLEAELTGAICDELRTLSELKIAA